MSKVADFDAKGFQDHVADRLRQHGFDVGEQTGTCMPCEVTTKTCNIRSCPDIVGACDGVRFIVDTKRYVGTPAITSADEVKLLDNMLQHKIEIGIFVTPKGINGRKGEQHTTVYWDGITSVTWIEDIAVFLKKQTETA